MKISLIKSLNHSKKKRNISKIDFIIIHYTGMQSKRASIERLTSKKHQVSTHYLIDRAGKTIKMKRKPKKVMRYIKERKQECYIIML